ncbi:MAG: DNA mismatch repair endonuclease MutL [Pseudomonadota bacterium]
MGSIRILPEKVAAQIAAGEVVERPASVVRELTDNSIDAGSDRIVIRIQSGGKRLIRVSDNGTGMTRDDLLLCVERHATSKITTLSDLFAIKTLGFRGEALPSISSVSRMQITSRTGDQLIGHRLEVIGGRLKSIEETGAPAGTTIEVRDLFFNVPVRRKFLRATKTETHHIMETLSRIALPHTSIHFRLDEEEKMLLNFPATENFLDRLSALLGGKAASSMIEAHQEAGETGVSIFLSPPDLSRTRGDHIFVYVNGRHIRDRMLTRAIMEGYGQRLMKGHYPQAVVFLEMNPSLVDVNVHPTKQEVRFHQGPFVYEILTSAIEKALRGLFHFGFEKGPASGEGPEEVPFGGLAGAEPIPAYSGVQEQGPVYGEKGFQDGYVNKDTPHILGQLKDTYILCQAKDGLLMIDQHAAHERIVYETLKRSFRNSKVEGQPFLIPPKLEFSMKEADIIQKKMDQLARFGVEIEHFGGNTFLLRSVPAILVNGKWEEFLKDVVLLLEEEAEFTNDKAMDRLLTAMACHGAIRAGQPLSHGEMASLLKELGETELSTNCPHGRPVIKKFTYVEIERMFKRVL